MKYHILTWGCQMNEHDSEVLSGMLEEMNYTRTEKLNEADIIILNTCCVRENAEIKVFGRIGQLKHLKHKNPNLIIAVCGCMTQQKGVAEKIAKNFPYVDLVFGTYNLDNFPELLQKAVQSKTTFIEVLEKEEKIIENLPVSRADNLKAWVTIIYGCNNFCSYCIVPYVRGRERSRLPKEIIKEVERLAEKGYKEITLLGQNVNSYGKDLKTEIDFSGLLKELNKINGIERIRFMTSHPKDFSDSLIFTIKECKKICEHIHLPVQAGSNKVLKMMNRHYTKERYIELVEKIRSEIPECSITTDIIVGFPGETEEDFQETLGLVEKVEFDSAFTFVYSKRTGTPAATMPCQVDERIKKNRLERLMDLQNRISKQKNQLLKGKTVEVLVEGYDKSKKGKLFGRTRTNKLVHFDGSKELIGRLVNVKITNPKTWTLDGVINQD